MSKTSEVIHLGAFRLYRDGKSPYWQVRAEAAPRDPLYKSTGEENKTLAMRKAKEIYADWSNEKEFKPSDQIIFKDLWAHYVEEQATYQKASTMKRIISVGEIYLKPVFGNRFLTEVQGIWSQFVRREKVKRPKSNLFNERKYLLAALTYAYENGYLDKVPPIKSVERQPTPFKVFTDKEIHKLIAVSSNGLRLQILMGYTMGMRHGEIAKLAIDDIDQFAGTIHVKDTKTKVDRIIAMSVDVRREIDDHISLARDRGAKYLFPQVHNPQKPKDQRVWDKEWQRVKLKKSIEGRFHDLRHSCATRLAASHVPAEVAAAYLGMSLRVYDRTYCHLGMDDTKQASLVVSLPDPVALAVDKGPKVLK